MLMRRRRCETCNCHAPSSTGLVIPNNLMWRFLGTLMLSSICCAFTSLSLLSVIRTHHLSADAVVRFGGADVAEETDNMHSISLKFSTSSSSQGRVSTSALATHDVLETNLQLAAFARQCEDPNLKHNRTAIAVKAYHLFRTIPEPDTVAYNSVLKVLSKISPALFPDPLLQHDDDNDTPAHQQQQPTFVAFRNSTIASTTATTCTGTATTTAAERARLLLEEMKLVHARQVSANQAWYAQLRQKSALSLQTQKTTEEQQPIEFASGGGGVNTLTAVGPPRVCVKPNVRSYATVMDAFARHATAEAAEVCQDLLQELDQLHRETGDAALKPNVIAYNTCLSAWAKASCSQECWELFQGMPVEPDIISINVVLHSLARSGWNNAGERAEAILQSLQDQERDPDDDPSSSSSSSDSRRGRLVGNHRTYTTCMDVWARCGRPDKAQQILQQLLDLYDRTGDDCYKPNCVPYSTVIHAYAVSKDPNKAIEAFRVFQDMKERQIKPNRVVLNNLLNCFATSRPHPETILLVETLYYQMLKHQQADHYTFGTVLKAVTHLFWKDRDFAPSVFRESCQSGQVSAGVLFQLRQAVPVETYRELVGGDHMDVNRLPAEWRRNVVDERSRRRRR